MLRGSGGEWQETSIEDQKEDPNLVPNILRGNASHFYRFRPIILGRSTTRFYVTTRGLRRLLIIVIVGANILLLTLSYISNISIL
jgi:hypothetical protein